MKPAAALCIAAAVGAAALPVRAQWPGPAQAVRFAPERGEYALFTLPYVSVPAVVVLRSDQPDRTLAAMAGKAVAVGQGYAVEPVMRRRYPRVAWQGVSDDGAALRQAVLRRWLGEPTLSQRTPWATRIGWGLLATSVIVVLLAAVRQGRRHTRGRGA